MTVSDWNEYRYRTIVRSIGFALLFFLLFSVLSDLLFGFYLYFFSVSTIGQEIVYELTYGVAYLATFMLPVAILKSLIGHSGYPYRPMQTNVRLSPWLPLILLGGVSLILAFSYCNVGLTDFFGVSSGLSSVFGNKDGSRREGYRLVLDFITMCLVPAFCEEFLFRGAILTNCLPFGRGSAILISAILFGVMHQNVGQIFYAFCAGILLGLVYERTGNIWNCVFLHLVNNFFAVFEEPFAQIFDGWTSFIAPLILECVLFLLGAISVAVLVGTFFSDKTKFCDGIFGKDVPATDDYAECPVRAGRSVRLFVNVPMVFFFVFSFLKMVIW